MTEKYELGDIVEWEHKTSSWYPQRKINCLGIIEKIFVSTVAGKKRDMVAKIRIIDKNDYFDKMGRKTTTISLRTIGPKYYKK